MVGIVQRFNNISKTIVGDEAPIIDAEVIVDANPVAESTVENTQNTEPATTETNTAQPPVCKEAHDISVLDENIPNLFTDFEKVRDILTKQSQKTIKILDCVSGELEIDPTNSELLESYASLNRALNDTTKLFVNSYKDLANVFSTISKMKLTEAETKQKETAAEHISAINTDDIIKHISGRIGIDYEEEETVD